MRSLLLALFLSVLVLAPVRASDEAIAAAVELAVAAQDRPAQIKADVAYLADDARKGRAPGTTGYDTAADYVAARLEQLGVAPGVDGSFMQPVGLRRAQAATKSASFAITDQDDNVKKLTWAEDFVISGTAPSTEIDVSGGAVFVGFGVSAPEADYDDYAGLDVAGKVVVAFPGAPDILGPEEKAYLNSANYKLAHAADKGAIGFVYLPRPSQRADGAWAKFAARLARPRRGWIHPDGASKTPDPRIKGVSYLSPDAARTLFEGAVQSFDEAADAVAAKEGVKTFDLGKSTSFSANVTHADVKSANVVGVIEGSHPRLKKEAVVLTAHLDHLGERIGGAGDDHIFNGAMDNAMGVAVMLEAARAFREGRAPKRTIVFLAVTGEEQGLLGSDYFAHYPTLGGKKIVANVNLDMPLTLFPFTDVIAFGADRSSLGKIVRKAARAEGVELIPDPVPEMSIFTRSDHYRFVEQGVPSVFLFLGFGNGGEEIFRGFMEKTYHSPGDDLSLAIDYEQAARFAKINYMIARKISDARRAPRWLNGDFFGERLASGKGATNAAN